MPVVPTRPFHSSFPGSVCSAHRLWQTFLSADPAANVRFQSPGWRYRSRPPGHVDQKCRLRSEGSRCFEHRAEHPPEIHRTDPKWGRRSTRTTAATIPIAKTSSTSDAVCSLVFPQRQTGGIPRSQDRRTVLQFVPFLVLYPPAFIPVPVRRARNDQPRPGVFPRAAPPIRLLTPIDLSGAGPKASRTGPCPAATAAS